MVINSIKRQKRLNKYSIDGAVYQVVCKISGHRYIGCTIKINQRKKQHFCGMRNGNHTNKKMNYIWKKYGKDNISFQILELHKNVSSINGRVHPKKYKKMCENEAMYMLLTDEKLLLNSIVPHKLYKEFLRPNGRPPKNARKTS